MGTDNDAGGDRKQPRAGRSRERKLQKRSHATRDAIIEAALGLFADRGFEGTATRAIAERAGVTQALLTYHFGTKDELWREAAASIFKVLRHNRRRSRNLVAGKAIDRVSEAFHAMFESTLRRPEIHQFMLREASSGNDRLRWLVDCHLRPYLDFLLPDVEQSQRDGDLPAGDSVVLYYLILGMITVPASLGPEIEAATGRSCRAPGEAKLYWSLISALVFPRR